MLIEAKLLDVRSYDAFWTIFVYNKYLWDGMKRITVGFGGRFDKWDKYYFRAFLVSL